MSAPKQEKTVATPTDEVAKMLIQWKIIEALRGGTEGMRDAGHDFLPKRALEDSADYAARLSQATLFPAFTETTKTMTGRVFSDPVKMGDTIPSWIVDEVLDNIDQQGRNFHVFLRDVFNIGMDYGLTHVLVDSPVAPEGAQPLTVKDQKDLNLRPYCVHLNPDRIIGWRETGGILTQLRVAGTRVAEDGEWGTASVDQVKVYEVGSVETFEQDKDGKWQSVSKLPMKSKVIPLVTFYTKRTGFMTGCSPLQELAYLNAKHWSMQSDNDELVHTASVPILVAYGMDDGDSIVIGSKSALKMPADGSLEYTEHTGAAISAGRTALDSLKEEMRDAGAKLLLRTQGTKTATQAGEDADRENSGLGCIVQDFDDFMDALLDMIAQWRNVDDGGEARAQPNLDPDYTPVESMRLLIDMNASGKLSDETLFNEGKRRDLISDEVTWEDEQVRINEQPLPTVPSAPVLGPDGLPLDIPPINPKPVDPTKKVPPQ